MLINAMHLSLGYDLRRHILVCAKDCVLTRHCIYGLTLKEIIQTTLTFPKKTNENHRKTRTDMPQTEVLKFMVLCFARTASSQNVIFSEI